MQETIAEWLTTVEDESKIKSNYEVLYTNSCKAKSMKVHIHSHVIFPACTYLRNVAIQQNLQHI